MLCGYPYRSYINHNQEIIEIYEKFHLFVTYKRKTRP